MDPTELFLLLVGVAATAVVVAILLDWLANPGERPFRPRGDRIPRRWTQRRAWRRRRDADDAAEVRATLQRTYGRPTLRGRLRPPRRAPQRADGGRDPQDGS